jgi:hypothetical protein
MSRLRIEPVDETTLEDWRHVHNVIIPTASLSLEEVRERAGRNHLEVAYLGDVLVGCSPTDCDSRCDTGSPRSSATCCRATRSPTSP